MLFVRGEGLPETICPRLDGLGLDACCEGAEVIIARGPVGTAALDSGGKAFIGGELICLT